MKRGALPRSRAPTAGEIVRGRRRSDHHAVHHQLQLVNLNLTSLDTVRRFSDARHLVILDLHSNFLSDISGLSGCVNLVQLDLHNNQLTELPPTSFWQRFLRLRVLYLHNNAIAGQHGAAAAVESLAGCPKLQVLTLFDNPLAMISGYRVYVTNMIWSLLALDQHVIADCEVVEGMRRVGPYAACTNRYARKCHTRLVGDFDVDYLNMCHLLANIYIQQRKNSPIQVVQRAIHRYLALSKEKPKVPLMPEGWRDVVETKIADDVSGGPTLDPPSSPTEPAVPIEPVVPEPVVPVRHVEVDQYKLMRQVDATFEGSERHPRSEYLDWVKDNVLDGTRRRSRPGRNETDGSELLMPSFEKEPDRRKRSMGHSLHLTMTTVSPPRGGTVGHADPRPEPVMPPAMPPVQTRSRRTTGPKSSSTSANFLRPLMAAETQRDRQRRDNAERVQKKHRAKAVKREEARIAYAVAEQKAVEQQNTLDQRQKDERVIQKHVNAVRAADEKLRLEHVEWRKYEKDRRIVLVKERTELLAQLRAEAAEESTELVTQYRQQTVQAKMAKSAHAKMQRENLQRARADVHATLRERRLQAAHTSVLESCRLQTQRERLANADETSRRRLVAKSKQAKLQPDMVRKAVQSAAESRERPCLQGFPAKPASLSVVPHHTPVQLFTEPGEGIPISVVSLPAESYPKSMWPHMPPHVIIDARLRELKARWASIGNFCVLEKCRSDPLQACPNCFANFRSFVTLEIINPLA